MRAFIILLSAIFLVVQAIDVIQERNSNHYHHDPYQYTHVKNPGVYEWGYNRGNHAGHSRSQVLKAAHHNHFQSEVIFSWFHEIFSKGCDGIFVVLSHIFLNFVTCIFFPFYLIYEFIIYDMIKKFHGNICKDFLYYLILK